MIISSLNDDLIYGADSCTTAVVSFYTSPDFVSPVCLVRLAYLSIVAVTIRKQDTPLNAPTRLSNNRCSK